MFRLLAYQRRTLSTACRLDGGDLGVSSTGARFELLQPPEIRAQLADEVGLGTGYVAVVVQLARDAAGLLARKQELHPALLPIEVAEREQPPKRLAA